MVKFLSWLFENYPVVVIYHAKKGMPEDVYRLQTQGAKFKWVSNVGLLEISWAFPLPGRFYIKGITQQSADYEHATLTVMAPGHKVRIIGELVEG